MLFRVLSKFALGAALTAATVFGGAVMALPAAAQTPAPTVVSATATSTATVESVDQAARQVLLRDSTGNLLTVDVGPGVRNLAQVKPGDTVTIQLIKAVGVQIVPPGQAPPSPQVEQGEARAAKGQLPAGAVYQLVNTNVTFTSYDAKTHLVAFTDASGAAHQITLITPAMRHFASQLKAGQQVQLAYLQAITIQVQK